MACDLTLGRLEPCKDSLGGIKALYFENFAADDTITYDVTNTDEITDIQVAATGAITVYKYDVKGDNSNLEQNINSSRDNGTTFFEQIINATLKKLDVATHKELKLMAHGRTRVFVHTNNGDAFCVGVEFGAEVTGGTVVTGSALGDLSGYTIVLTAQEKTPANFLQGATAADPFAGLTTAPTVVEGT